VNPATTGRALALAAGAVLLAPAAAGAATKTVYAGPPPAQAKPLAALKADANAFFPASVTIRVGDKIAFPFAGFHNVRVLKKGAKTGVAFIAPNGTNVADVKDAAGAAMWFNGLPFLALNPKVLFGDQGKTVKYDGRTAVASGAPTGPKPQPMTVQFTKAGSATFVCDIHPGMKGTVKVLPRSKKAPSAAADAKRVKAQVAAAVGVAKSLTSAPEAPGVFDLGRAGAGGVELFDIYPKAATMSVGATVTFRMTAGSLEAHTATTGPGDAEKEPSSYLGKLAASFEAPTGPDQLALYPSDLPPAGPAALTPALHGNGFWNSGALDLDTASTPPSTSQVTLAAAGTYRFYCLIHPGMSTTITAG
jgi:plastocyanin